MTSFNAFLFGIYPYIALVTLFLGTLIRYDREQYSWQASSSQILSDKGLAIGNIFFHLGIIFIFMGHFVGLLTPHALYEHFIKAEQKQMLAIVAGGIAGVFGFIGLSILLMRRLGNPRIRATSSPLDILILVLLWVQMGLGLITIPFSLSHHDATQMLNLSEWAQHILTLRGGAAEYIANVDLIFKCHLFVGLTILLLFPFTRLVHMLSIPVKYLPRPFQIVRARQARR